MRHPQDHDNYDLFKCPCGAQFRRKQLVGCYPHLACPACKREADTAWIVVEEPKARMLRVARLVMNERSKVAFAARQDYRSACKIYAAAYKDVHGVEPPNNPLREDEPTIVEGDE